MESVPRIISPGCPIHATTLLHGADSPSGSRILSRMPSASASTSFVNLSVATEKSTSPFCTGWPSLIFHSSIVPSVMVKPNLGINTSVAIAHAPFCTMFFAREHLRTVARSDSYRMSSAEYAPFPKRFEPLRFLHESKNRRRQCRRPFSLKSARDTDSPAVPRSVS